MGAEAGRAALRGRDVRPESLWFATTEPAYADRTNATVLHAVLRLDRTVPAYDMVGSVRSAMAALRATRSSMHLRRLRSIPTVTSTLPTRAMTWFAS